MERIINITGWSKQHRQQDQNPEIGEWAKGTKPYETGYVVYRYNDDGTKTYLTVDPDKTFTLKRMAGILADAEALTGNIYASITVKDVLFDDDHRTITAKKYTYNKALNRLRIWEQKPGQRDLMPIYENNDGIICNDPDALADCLL